MTLQEELATNKYAQLAMRFHSQIGKKVGGFEKGPMLWALADYLATQDNGKHEQHLLMLASKWVKALQQKEHYGRKKENDR